MGRRQAGRRTNRRNPATDRRFDETRGQKPPARRAAREYGYGRFGFEFPNPPTSARSELQSKQQPVLYVASEKASQCITSITIHSTKQTRPASGWRRSTMRRAISQTIE